MVCGFVIELFIYTKRFNKFEIHLVYQLNIKQQKIKCQKRLKESDTVHFSPNEQELAQPMGGHLPPLSSLRRQSKRASSPRLRDARHLDDPCASGEDKADAETFPATLAFILPLSLSRSIWRHCQAADATPPPIPWPPTFPRLSELS